MTAEKAIFEPIGSGGATIVETVGYVGGSEVPVFTKTYTTAGTAAFATWIPLAGDTAALIRYSTPDRSTKNHPIYCFNYYHATGSNNSLVAADTLNTAQRAAMAVYAADWLAGFSDGTNTLIRSRPNGNACTGSLVELLVTHRDLPH